MFGRLIYPPTTKGSEVVTGVTSLDNNLQLKVVQKSRDQQNDQVN